jgi:hypothetical protein
MLVSWVGWVNAMTKRSTLASTGPVAAAVGWGAAVGAGPVDDSETAVVGVSAALDAGVSSGAGASEAAGLQPKINGRDNNNSVHNNIWSLL